MMKMAAILSFSFPLKDALPHTGSSSSITGFSGPMAACSTSKAGEKGPAMRFVAEIQQRFVSDEVSESSEDKG